jgi:NAD(P)-dependent dehydrogenase (short-subunit alcohol dehydrogenase family)
MNKQPVALVTGGSRGIGKGIALELAKAGFTILVNYNRNNLAAAEVVEEIEQAGGKADTCQGDISIPEHRHLLMEYCMEDVGRLDMLVNNAGIAPPERLDILETTESNYRKVMDVNLLGPFFLTQAAANFMINQLREKTIPKATIVNVNSISAYTASVNRGEYCISKAGLSMVTSLFASRLAEYGINVYEVRPGIVATDMTSGVTKKYDKLIKDGLTPIRRWGQPEDVGKAVAAIGQGYFPFSTGEVINVDGGFHMKQL